MVITLYNLLFIYTMPLSFKLLSCYRISYNNILSCILGIRKNEKCPSIRKVSLIPSKMALIQEKCQSKNLKNLKKHQNRAFKTLNWCYISSIILNKWLDCAVFTFIQRKKVWYNIVSNLLFFNGGPDRIWTSDQAVAVPCLTTWLQGHIRTNKFYQN